MKSQKNKSIILIAFLLSILTCAGCWDYREINQSAVPITLACDLGKDKKINVSTLLSQPTPPGETSGGQMNMIYVSSSDYSVALAARRTMLSLSRVPEWIHIQTIVMGENLARNGLPLTMDFLTRNRVISPNVNLLVAVQTSPEKIMASACNFGCNLKQLVMINQTMLGTYVPITKDYFTYILMTPGIEAAVPQIIVEQGPQTQSETSGGDKNIQKADNNTKRIVLSGTAVFKGDKMVGSLNEYESRGYRWLDTRSRMGGFMVIKSPANHQEEITLEILRFKSNTIPQISNNRIQMKISINAELAFYETSGSSELLDQNGEKKLEIAANQEIKRQVESCIQKSQKLNSDILGWGLKTSEHQPNAWKQVKNQWNNQYPLIDYKINVKSHVIHSYLSSKTFKIE